VGVEDELVVEGTKFLVAGGLVTLGIVGLLYLKRRWDVARHGDPAKIASVGLGKPHFELSPHGCAGCGWASRLHYGCVVDDSARRA